MQKLNFDTGMRKFQINDGAVLQFNPSDINLYSRFIDATDQFKKIEADMVAKAQAIENPSGEDTILLMREADAEVKNVLQNIFGKQNDFDAIFEGVNVMAVAPNGERVITNFIVAISPIIEDGAKNYAKAKAAAVAGGVKPNRAQRRALK